MSHMAGAQSVLIPRPVEPVGPVLVEPAKPEEDGETNQVGIAKSGKLKEPVVKEDQPLRWGPVTLRPGLYYRFYYANGIQSAPGQAANTFINEIAPSIALDLGNYWKINYTPVKRLYSSDQFKDTLDQIVNLAGAAAYKDWSFGLNQYYASTDTPQVQTATQTEQQNFATTLTATYIFNGEMSMDLGVNQNFYFTQEFTDTREWNTLNWLNYQFWPRLNAAVGVGAGYANVDPGIDMTYEQLQARIRWRTTDKVSLEAHGGVEDRQFLSGSAANLINPVFGGTFEYQPYEYTRFALHADRVVAVSYFENQVTESFDILGDFNQRLLKRLFLSAGGGYHRVKYVTTTSDSIARTDDYYSINARLNCPILRRGNIALIYQYSQNGSTDTGFAFSSNQVGFELGFQVLVPSSILPDNSFPARQTSHFCYL